MMVLKLSYWAVLAITVVNLSSAFNFDHGLDDYTLAGPYAERSSGPIFRSEESADGEAESENEQEEVGNKS